VLSRHAVSGTPSAATDIRWASERSVYLSRLADGVEEVVLAPGGKSRTRRDYLLPALAAMRQRFGYWAWVGFSRLAVSAETILASGSHQNIAWVRSDPSTGLVEGLQSWEGLHNEDLDLHGSTMVLLGMPPSERPIEEQTEIVWLGSLDRRLEDLRPVLHDARAGAVPSFVNCQGLELGAVRFREDGSFYVAPGIQPGLHLFDPQGKLVRTWETRSLGFDVDCRRLDKKKMGLAEAGARLAFVNQEGRRVLDEILALPQGPGLVLRTWSRGSARWDLFVLTAAGVRHVPLPLTSSRPFDRLRGDVRNGKIALLRSAHISGGLTAEGEIVVLSVPRD
jgi:hypothetical protein